VSEQNKAVVRRLIDEVFNNGLLERIDERYTLESAESARRWIESAMAGSPKCGGSRTRRSGCASWGL
jgi:hypothetical protein